VSDRWRGGQAWSYPKKRLQQEVSGPQRLLEISISHVVQRVRLSLSNRALTAQSITGIPENHLCRNRGCFWPVSSGIGIARTKT
jgi:hypothetical protein